MKKVAGVVPLFVSVLALAGCGSGGSEAAVPSSEDTGASSSAEPSGAPTPAAAPATGREVRLVELVVRFPDSYSYVQRQSTFGWIGLGPSGDTLSMAEIDAGPRTDDRKLEQDAHDLSMWRGVTPERGDDVEVDGVSMMHLHGTGGPATTATSSLPLSATT
ncbi:hypothetical protein ACFP3Q_06430 [Nocardioides sp. GCM10027113]|uniref:hypothetical protein n=1 Tax=unclassified Nocardioides TaxID=2615069 RepID=UPI003612A518